MMIKGKLPTWCVCGYPSSMIYRSQQDLQWKICITVMVIIMAMMMMMKMKMMMAMMAMTDDDEYTANDEQWWPKNICVTFQNGQWRSTDYPKG